MTYNEFIIERKLKEFLEEDCSFKDVTSTLIPPDAHASAKIIVKSGGFISGLKELEILFQLLNIKAKFHVKDGNPVQSGDVIVELTGNAREILFGERVGLNVVTHMSAITTMTRYFTDMIKKEGKRTKIAGTRKTIPGMRVFEKRAMELGEGDPHRFSLDDMILIKDTHLRYHEGKIEQILKKAKQISSFSKKIEIEVERVEDVIIAAKNGADIIMLDNMNPKEVERSIKLLSEEGLRDRVLVEVSGGINRENINAYLASEPDVISTSELTQFPSEHVDLSLRFD